MGAAFDFIFMLTRQDRTVPDAAERLELALGVGLRHIGFKDVGLPFAALRGLNRTIQAAGARSYLEVVSTSREAEIASVRAALDLGVDELMGGTHVDDVLPLLAGSRIRYRPFPGRVAGHPSVLDGEAADIVASARALAARPGVDGLDLLAWRSRHDGAVLTRAVCAAVAKPVIVAGSIATPEQVHAVRAAGAAGFTIGSAAMDGLFPAEGPELERQLGAIAAAAARACNDEAA